MQEVNLRDGYRLVDRVHAHLRAAILSGELMPGTHLVETELAKRLGVSRSPVREAIMRLEQESLVTTAGLRVMVCEISRADIDDLFWIRCALEGVAARQATLRLSTSDLEAMRELCLASADAFKRGDFVAVSRLGDEFHSLFVRASGNSRLRKMLGDVKAYIDRFRSVSAASPGRGKETLAEHLAILEAFEARDPDRAEQLVRRHIQGALAALLNESGAGVATQADA